MRSTTIAALRDFWPRSIMNCQLAMCEALSITLDGLRLAPRLAAFAAAAFVRTDPILIPLALAEVLIIIKARRLNSLPNRLFVSWLAGGLLAHFGSSTWPYDYVNKWIFEDQLDQNAPRSPGLMR